MANGKHPNHANSTTTEAHTKCQIHLQRQNVARRQKAPDRYFRFLLLFTLTSWVSFKASFSKQKKKNCMDFLKIDYLLSQ